MAAATIDGKAIAQDVRAAIARRTAELRESGGAVRLDAVLVADPGDSAAHVYARNQRASCEALGIEHVLHELSASCGEEEILAVVDKLNRRADVHAVMVHMPLPSGVDAYRIQRAIAPEKDVEGVNPANIGNIVYGRSSLAPCTALAVLKMIDSTGLELPGRRAIVVGASDIVGKPVAVMLMRREATVISCNVHTPDTPELARSADVLVAAAGVRGLVDAAWIKPGAVVIDVGIHRVRGDSGRSRTVGDVEFAAVAEYAGWISPVPGGVGPVTVAMLLENVVAAAEQQIGAACGR